MKIYKVISEGLLVLTTASMLLFSAPASASSLNAASKPPQSQSGQDNAKGKGSGQDIKKDRDPIKMLQRKKEQIAELVKEGKLTKEKGDEITKRIDERIKEIEKFNALPLEEKKKMLKSKFQEKLNKRVQSGELTKEKADELYQKFVKSVDEWDGNGYPKPFRKPSETRKNKK